MLTHTALGRAKPGTAIALALASLLSLSGCGDPTTHSAEQQVQTALTTSQATLAWLDASAQAQAQAIANSQLNSADLVQGYLTRIEQVDGKINSILRLNPHALDEAKKLDALRDKGDILGPLHGIPVLVKDNIETKELPTTAGSIALLNNNTHRDAPIIAQLRAAGAIILGKTNLSEWANFRSESSISGWSAVGGLTRNPHMLNRSACGSSSGSGAAMAARLSSLAIGSETNGSIICPSAMNGIVGFKPTVGLLSRTHIVPISSTQDTAGPMVQTVVDAALMADVMASVDPNDVATQSDARPTMSLIPTSADLNGMTIGVARFAQGDNPDIVAAFNASLAYLEQQGATLVDIEAFSLESEFWGHSYHVLLAEFKDTIADYLHSSPADIPARDLASLIALHKQSERELSLFDVSIFEKAQATEGTTGEQYQTALAYVRNATRTEGLDKLLADNQVDVIVAPSNNPAFMIDAVYGDHSPVGFLGIGYLAAIAGYPHVTIPMGKVSGLPVGFSVLGGQWQDAKVLQVGYGLEQAREVDMTPHFWSSRFDDPELNAPAQPLN